MNYAAGVPQDLLLNVFRYAHGTVEDAEVVWIWCLVRIRARLVYIRLLGKGAMHGPGVDCEEGDGTWL